MKRWTVIPWLASSALVFSAEPASLTVKYLNVGQADAALIICPTREHRMLIDSGDTRYPGSAAAFKADFQEALGPQGAALTIAVASHPHADHIGSMQWVLENYAVRIYVDNGQRTETASFGRLNALRRKLVDQGKLTYVNAKENVATKLTFCPLIVAETLEPWAVMPLSDTNDRSVVVRLVYNKISFLFVGDCEIPAEEVMLNSFTEALRKDLDVDVLKVGHHGSDTSSLAQFIAAVSPQLTVISCGKKGVGTNSRYKHPRLSTLRTLGDWFRNQPPPSNAPAATVWAYNADAKRWQQQTRSPGVWLTSNDGSITVRTDGQTLQVETDQEN